MDLFEIDYTSKYSGLYLDGNKIPELHTTTRHQDVLKQDGVVHTM